MKTRYNPSTWLNFKYRFDIWFRSTGFDTREWLLNLKLSCQHRFPVGSGL
jgi:hypothetical protein